MDNIPSYKRIYLSLKQSIRDGAYKPGMLIPTEPELEKQFGVSRTTVRRAVGMLHRDGYVRAMQGRGTKVLDVSTTQRLNFITSITETLREKGYKVTTRGMCIDSIVSPNDASEALELPKPNTVVYRIQRIIHVNDKPFGIIINYLPTGLVPNLDAHTGKFTSLYNFLENEYGLVLESAVEKISATVADFTESQMLGINVGDPLLYSRRTTYTISCPLEYAKSKLLADKYQFSIYLKGRP